jgi:hypothetical protein
MARQAQIPGADYVNQTGTRQAQIPGSDYVNETVATGGATWKTTLGVTTAAGIKTVFALALASIKTDLGLSPR